MGQRSYEWQAEEHGAFTYYLMEALRSDAWDPSGRLKMPRVAEYVEAKVSQWARASGYEQRPRSKQEGSIKEIILAERSVPELERSRLAVIEELSTLEVLSDTDGTEVVIDGGRWVVTSPGEVVGIPWGQHHYRAKVGDRVTAGEFVVEGYESVLEVADFGLDKGEGESTALRGVAERVRRCLDRKEVFAARDALIAARNDHPEDAKLLALQQSLDMILEDVRKFEKRIGESLDTGQLEVAEKWIEALEDLCADSGEQPKYHRRLSQMAGKQKQAAQGIDELIEAGAFDDAARRLSRIRSLDGGTKKALQEKLDERRKHLERVLQELETVGKTASFAWGTDLLNREFSKFRSSSRFVEKKIAIEAEAKKIDALVEKQKRANRTGQVAEEIAALEAILASCPMAVDARRRLKMLVGSRDDVGHRSLRPGNGEPPGRLRVPALLMYNVLQATFVVFMVCAGLALASYSSYLLYGLFGSGGAHPEVLAFLVVLACFFLSTVKVHEHYFMPRIDGLKAGTSSSRKSERSTSGRE
ncbi:MAG: hypothetical protein ABIK09_05845 [Pseudomonadota bacterium]